MSLRDRLGAADPSEAVGNSPSTPQAQLLGRVHQQIVARLSEESGEGSDAASAGDAMRGRVTALASDMIDREMPGLSPRERNAFVESICNEIFGFGPITPLLQDSTVSEVMVNGPYDVYCERSGRISKTPYSFRDARHVMAVVDRILGPLGRRVDEASPMVDARLPDGSRVNVVIPPVSLTGPVVTIRKFREDGLSMVEMVGLGSLTREMAQFLQNCVESKLNILVSGGTATGKTTMLNALSNHISADERIVTIEDAAELRLRQGHVISLEARPSNAEGKGEVTIRAMLRNALRMRPDRIVIGEVRGGEAMDLLQAMNTGHDGCLSTLHANKPRDALARLETMALMANLDLPVRVIREQIASALDLIVHQDRFEDGTRRVSSITEVHGMEGEVITLHDVYVYERHGVTPEGRVQGQFVRTAVRPAVLDRFRRYGLTADAWRQGGPEGVMR